MIRGRTWHVGWITRHRDCTSIRVASDDCGVAPTTFLHPFDDVRPLGPPNNLKRVSRRQAVAALRAALLDAAPFPALAVTWSTSIDLLPYQLEPALALLAGTATRVLLADDVGLGKTIQAGIAIRELAARNEANHVLVIVPAGLIDQWADELHSRFALIVERVDATWLRTMSRVLPPWVNPWTVPGVLLVSMDLLKRGEVLSQVEHSVWDLVVIDEAHRTTGATDRHRAASHVCSHARRVVLLTATPHAGDPTSFAQLQQLGAIPHDETQMLTFARTRSAIAPCAVRRRVRYLRVALTCHERIMHAALDRYVARMWRAAGGTHADAVRLAMIVLKKRALSGAFSLKRSLTRRLASLEEQEGEPAQLGLLFDADPAGELVADDEEPDRVLVVDVSGAIPDERELIVRLIGLASVASAGESKIGVLRRVLARTREPAIVFTEYRDTLEHVAVEIAALTTPVLLHGGLAPEERRAAVSNFTRGTARVLLATDAAAEGLNLHERCRWVINLELPWAPLRLIQRAGRVDRIGQQRRVHAWHLVADGTDETRLLLSLSSRAEAATTALARERAIGEQAMAIALMDGVDPVVDAVNARTRMSNGATIHARRETARLQGIRALTATRRGNPQTRAGIAIVKRRGTFARFASGDLLLIFRGRALDAQCCPIAKRLGIARASARGTGSNDLARLLRGDMRRHDRAVSVATNRRRALSLLLQRSRRLVQPALFDRRALDSRDGRDAAIGCGRDQLEIRQAADVRASSIVFEVVAGFEVK